MKQLGLKVPSIFNDSSLFSKLPADMCWIKIYPQGASCFFFSELNAAFCRSELSPSFTAIFLWPFSSKPSSFLDIPPTFETDSLSVPTMWMPFGKRLLLYMSFTSAVEEGSEQTCVIFFIYFMSLLVVITWDDCASFKFTLFINSYY